MENNYDDGFTNELKPVAARPTFLKIISIFTFINCGIWIIVYLMGSLTLVIDQESAERAMERVNEAVPNLQMTNDDAYTFFHEIGKMCLLELATNIISLVGAIMMWNFNKIGFYLYVFAEIAANFIGGDVNTGGESGTSYGSLIFSVIFDIAFIVMYAVHLKYMNKNKTTVS